MKTLFLIPLLFINMVLWGQANQPTKHKTFLPEEDCHLALFALDGQATIYAWNEPTIKIVLKNEGTTPRTENYIQAIEMRFHEEERVMIFRPTLPLKSMDNNTPTYFDIYVPRHMRYQVIDLTQPLLL